jgi:TatA/E family protein of Tat protein translocase
MGLDNPIHIAFLLILLLLVFGAKRLPEMGRSLGDGMRGFKDAIGGENPPTAQPMAQAALVAQPQTQEAAAPVQQVPLAHVPVQQVPVQQVPVQQVPVQQVPAQQVPAPVQAVSTPQPVLEKLPA